MKKRVVLVNNFADEHNRKLIETDTSTNFFVEAGAGSGKTTELVSRMLAMVENGVNGKDIDISQICAITFTKAAANEFYDRFQKALMDSESPKAKEALKNIDLCFMGTIDSFTNMIISEHPSDAKVPADACVVDQDEMHELWKAQLKLISNGDMGLDLKQKYEKFIKYCKNSEEFFVAGLDFLLNSKNAQFTMQAPADGDFADVFAGQISDITEALNFLVGDEVRVLNEGKGDRQAVYLAKLALQLTYKFEENLDSILRLLNKISGDACLRFDKSVDLDNYPGCPTYVKSLFYQTETKKGSPSFWKIKKIKDGGNPFYKKDFDNFIFSVAMDFISSCAKPISDNLKAAGKLSYNDYLYYLKETLKEDAANGGNLIKHIYQRHKYFLIDEFQDTDPVQAEIFFYLTASNLSEAKNWKDCIPWPGSLFIVGDPKQSIYRFRNADVASYINVKKLFENPKVGKVLELTQNFRSYKPVCSWFNDAFSEILCDKPGIQSPYVKIPLENKPEYMASLSGAQKQVYFGGNLKKSPACDNLVSIISEIVDNDKYTIEDPPRKVTYKDIMVITYKKAHLKFYMEALRKANIPYWVEGNVLFDDCPSLSALSAIINFVVNPQSKKAYAAVGLKMLEIFSVDKAQKYHDIALNITPSCLVQLIVDNEKLIAQTGTKNIEYLYFAIELLRAKETSAEITTLAELAEFLSDLTCGNTDQERCLQFAVNDNRVHLANLHKVKGLQAPVVIMTEANSTNHEPSHHVDYMAENPYSCIFELSGEGFGNKLNSWCYEEDKQLETDILNAEKDRLLYVAATRAKSVFIATDYKKKSGDGIPATNQAVNLLEQIKDTVDIGDSIDDNGRIIVENPRINKEKVIIKDRQYVDGLYEQSAYASSINRDKELATYKIERPSKISQLNDLEIDTEFSDKRDDAAFIGTVIHRLMELVVNSKLFDVNFDICVKQVVREYNLDRNLYVDILNNTITQSKELFEELKEATEIYCEMPFCYRSEINTYCDGVIDLVYCKNNKWHIVDYKTNYDSNNLDEKYKKQLEVYKKALKNLINVDASAKIFHIKI